MVHLLMFQWFLLHLTGLWVMRYGKDLLKSNEVDRAYQCHRNPYLWVQWCAGRF